MEHLIQEGGYSMDERIEIEGDLIAIEDFKVDSKGISYPLPNGNIVIIPKEDANEEEKSIIERLEI